MDRARPTAARRRGHCAALATALALVAAVPGFALAGHGLEPSSDAELLARCPDASVHNLALAGIRSSLVCLHNAERGKHGRSALTRNATLDGAAAKHADDMVARHYFSHVTPEGLDPPARARAAGYRQLVSENLTLRCALRRPSALELFRNWLGSAHHHSIMLDGKTRDIGIGVAEGIPSTICGRTAVAMLGRPRPTAASAGMRLPGGGRLIRGGGGGRRLVGTPYDDVIICGNGADRVIARGGDDRIDCHAGNDRIDAGSGNDRVNAGAGNDIVKGGTGRDVVNAGSGNDVVNGNQSGDVLRGQSGRDRIGAGSGNDRVSGGAGRDQLVGGSGRDRIGGGTAKDAIKGGSGGDRLFGNRGNDGIDGGSGSDRLFGGPGRDILLGGSGLDLLRGGPGRDLVRQ